jgi:hypothetical protein
MYRADRGFESSDPTPGGALAKRLGRKPGASRAKSSGSLQCGQHCAKAMVGLPADFLSRLVALSHCMRLSLKSFIGFADPRDMKRFVSSQLSTAVADRRYLHFGWGRQRGAEL